MELLTTLIIDDAFQDRKVLHHLLDDYCPRVHLKGEASSVDEGIHMINRNNPELVFLNIELGSQNGFELLDQVAEISFQFILVAEHSEFAIKALRYRALDYLLKPIQPDLLVAAVERAGQAGPVEQLQAQLQELRRALATRAPEKMIISTTEGLYFIPIDTIVHVAGSGNYSTFHLENGAQVLASKHLKYYEDLLPSPAFFRVHQSHLVNTRFIDKIRTLDGYVVELAGGHHVPLAQTRKTRLLARLTGVG